MQAATTAAGLYHVVGFDARPTILRANLDGKGAFDVELMDQAVAHYASCAWTLAGPTPVPATASHRRYWYKTASTAQWPTSEPTPSRTSVIRAPRGAPQRSCHALTGV